MKSIYYDANFLEIQVILGKRPGGYSLDPYYLRKGHGLKPYFWNSSTKKWELIHVGDRFSMDDDGTIIRESIK